MRSAALPTRPRDLARARLPTRPRALARALLATLVLLACRPAAPPAPATTCTGTIADAGFLTGAWQRRDGERRSDEQWSDPAGAGMFGHGRRTTATATQFFEFLRIEARAIGLVYIAQPGGGAPVEFRLTRCAPAELEFRNPAHDYPQRLHYRRVGDALHIEVAGPGPTGWVREQSTLHRAPP